MVGFYGRKVVVLSVHHVGMVGALDDGFGNGTVAATDGARAMYLQQRSMTSFKHTIGRRYAKSPRKHLLKSGRIKHGMHTG
jgi:hypothetical protein